MVRSSTVIGDQVEVVAAANTVFLNSFERWVEAGINCAAKGASIAERATKIKESFDKAIQANIHFHTEMSNASVDIDSRAMHLAMAQAYEVFIKN